MVRTFRRGEVAAGLAEGNLSGRRRRSCGRLWEYGIEEWAVAKEREKLMRRTHLSSPIVRAGPSDVVTLATDRGPAPMNIGAVLIIDAGV